MTNDSTEVMLPLLEGSLARYREHGVRLDRVAFGVLAFIGANTAFVGANPDRVSTLTTVTIIAGVLMAGLALAVRPHLELNFTDVRRIAFEDPARVKSWLLDALEKTIRITRQRILTKSALTGLAVVCTIVSTVDVVILSTPPQPQPAGRPSHGASDGVP